MSSTAVVPVQDLDRMALAFANSKFFGAKDKDQVMSLLLLAQAEGVHPAIAMRDFDIIQGRPAKKAEAMHRAFLAAGGKIVWHKLTDELADATFSHPQGGEARITWDMARAQKAGLKSKDMYSKYPRQMLKARVVSEGCRTVYPAATSGLYVPEEVRHFDPPPAPKEKDMGAAVLVEDEDITHQIPGVGAPDTEAAPQASGSPVPPSSSQVSQPAEAAPIKTRTETLTELCGLAKRSLADFLDRAKVQSAEELTEGDYLAIKSVLDKIISKKAA